MSTPTPDKNGIRWYGHRGSKQKQVAGRCIAEVSDHDARWTHYFQCSRKASVGDYCKRHAPITGSEVWWRVSKYSENPEAVEFAGSTDAQLIHKNGRREAQSSQYYEYYKSEVGALEAIQSRIASKISSLSDEIDSLKESLSKVEVAMSVAKESSK